MNDTNTASAPPQGTRSALLMGLASVALAALLPIRPSEILRHFLLYVGTSVLRTPLLATLFGGAILIPLVFGRPRIMNRTHFRAVLALSLLTLATLRSLDDDLQWRRARRLPFSIAFFGCAGMTNDGNLRREPLSKRFELLFSDPLSRHAGRHSAFNDDSILYELEGLRIKVPTFLLLTWRPADFDAYVTKRLQGPLVAGFYCISNGQDKRPTIKLHLRADSFANLEGYPYGPSWNEQFLSTISSDGRLTYEEAFDVVGAYVIAVMGQSFHQILVQNKEYSRASAALTSSRDLFLYLASRVRARATPSNAASVDHLMKRWEALLEHMDADSLVQQRQYLPAARHAAAALRADPHYPYETAMTEAETYDAEYLRGYQKTTNEREESEADNQEVPSTGEQLREIVEKSDADPAVSTFVERAFLDVLGQRGDWLLWAQWGDLVKHLPKGPADQPNGFYQARIPDARTAYLTALKENPASQVLLLKLGMLDFFEAMDEPPGSPRAERLLDAGAAMIRRSGELATKMHVDGASMRKHMSEKQAKLWKEKTAK